MSNSVPRPVPNSSATMITATIGTHGRRALWASQCQNHSRSAVVWEQPREKGLRTVAISPPLGRVRRRPVAVVDDQAVFRERRPRLVGAGLDRIDVRPQRMRHPDIDDGRLLEPAPRAFFHDRVGLHEAAQAGDRAYLAVDQRDDAAFAHEGACVVGVIHQHPVEGGRKARLLRLRSFVDRGAPVVIGPRRGRHAVERVSHQRVVAEARQEFPVGPADGVAVESVGAGLGGAMLIHWNGFLACN